MAVFNQIFKWKHLIVLIVFVAFVTICSSDHVIQKRQAKAPATPAAPAQQPPAQTQAQAPAAPQAPAQQPSAPQAPAQQPSPQAPAQQPSAPQAPAQSQPAQQPATQPAQQPATQPAQQPATQPAQQPAQTQPAPAAPQSQAPQQPIPQSPAQTQPAQQASKGTPQSTNEPIGTTANPSSKSTSKVNSNSISTTTINACGTTANCQPVPMTPGQTAQIVTTTEPPDTKIYTLTPASGATPKANAKYTTTVFQSTVVQVVQGYMTTTTSKGADGQITTFSTYIPPSTIIAVKQVTGVAEDDSLSTDAIVGGGNSFNEMRGSSHALLNIIMSLWVVGITLFYMIKNVN